MIEKRSNAVKGHYNQKFIISDIYIRVHVRVHVRLRECVLHLHVRVWTWTWAWILLCGCVSVCVCCAFASACGVCSVRVHTHDDVLYKEKKKEKKESQTNLKRLSTTDSNLDSHFAVFIRKIDNTIRSSWCKCMIYLEQDMFKWEPKKILEHK